LPLKGIKVLDMTRVLAGVRYYPSISSLKYANGLIQPYCTQILGDLGYDSKQGTNVGGARS
jgi:hypothetical protein